MGEMYLHTRYWEPGAGGGGGWAGVGGHRKQTTKGAGNRPDTWSWGEGQKGKPEEQLGVGGGGTRATRESQD